jgi:hypothetical protein
MPLFRQLAGGWNVYTILQFLAKLSYHGTRQRRASAQREDRVVVEQSGMAKDWCDHEADPADRNVWNRQIDTD